MSTCVFRFYILHVGHSDYRCYFKWGWHSSVVTYADDILLYRPIRQASDYQRLQKDVEALGKWANDNYLTFNPSKSKAMVFSRKRNPVQAPSYLSLNGSTLEIVDSVKYLGITISSDLSWTKHINIISSKARKLVGLLFRQFYRHSYFGCA